MPKLSLRLSRAAELVRNDAIVADVGTDHAYLPIALCLCGKARRAVASDVNQGPLDRARQNVSAWNLNDKIQTVLCDGLSHIEPYAPTDILLLGMGGELIARILGDTEWIRREGLRLILQPMTHPEAVRAYLCGAGFAIVEEVLVEEDKVYQILCAEYTGELYEMNEVELLLGTKDHRRGDPLTSKLIARFRSVFEERMRGKQTVGADTKAEEQMLQQLEEYES